MKLHSSLHYTHQRISIGLSIPLNRCTLPGMAFRFTSYNLKWLPFGSNLAITSVIKCAWFGYYRKVKFPPNGKCVGKSGPCTHYSGVERCDRVRLDGEI